MPAVNSVPMPEPLEAEYVDTPKEYVAQGRVFFVTLSHVKENFGNTEDVMAQFPSSWYLQVAWEESVAMNAHVHLLLLAPKQTKLSRRKLGKGVGRLLDSTSINIQTFGKSKSYKMFNNIQFKGSKWAKVWFMEKLMYCSPNRS